MGRKLRYRVEVKGTLEIDPQLFQEALESTSNDLPAALELLARKRSQLDWAEKGRCESYSFQLFPMEPEGEPR